MTYIPTICIAIFLLLFLYCTTLYPGSSQHDINALGFTWQHNYWCDILEIETYDEQRNPSSYWGIAATLFLCLGTGWLFYQFPNHFGATLTEKWVIWGFGITSMVIASVIFTPLHNYVIALASGLALIAILTMFYVLFHQTQWPLFYYGVFACIIMLINNYIYYSRIGVGHLPWIQKISLVIVLAWIIMIDIQGNQEVMSK